MKRNGEFIKSMFIIEEEFINHIYNDLTNKQIEYNSVENLPIEFYDFYRDFLTYYKNIGLSKQLMIKLLTDLYKKHQDIAIYIYEILDLVLGHCSSDYQIFKE